MHCVWSQNCDTSGYHAMQAAWGVSTATWVAGTPSASMPDFTEPPEAPAVALYRLVQHCAACRMAWYGLNWVGICFWRSHTTSLSLSRPLSVSPCVCQSLRHCAHIISRPCIWPLTWKLQNVLQYFFALLSRNSKQLVQNVLQYFFALLSRNSKQLVFSVEHGISGISFWHRARNASIDYIQYLNI